MLETLFDPTLRYALQILDMLGLLAWPKSILFWTLVWLLGFLYLYVLVMGVYRAHLGGHLRRYHYVLFAPAVAIGWLVDLLSNWTLAIVIFMDLPQERLVTGRLKRYRKTLHADHRNRRIAEWLCDHVLDVFDPRGDHC